MNKKFSEAGIRILEVLSQNPKSPSYKKCIDKISNVSVKHTIVSLPFLIISYLSFYFIILSSFLFIVLGDTARKVGG